MHIRYPFNVLENVESLIYVKAMMIFVCLAHGFGPPTHGCLSRAEEETCEARLAPNPLTRLNTEVWCVLADKYNNIPSH